MDEFFVRSVASQTIGATYNQYAAAPHLQERLVEYLRARRRARLVLVGEAAGYRGARVSGIAFTSERQLTGAGPAEASATIVHRTLAELGLDDRDVVLWNVVPTHPHRPGEPGSNRTPTHAEIAAARPLLEALVGSLPRRTRVLAVGRVAHRELGGPYIRHPSRGGAAAFRENLRECLS